MKKWYLVAAVLTIVLLAISCSSAKLPIPPDAIDEIYAMSDGPASKYAEVKVVKDREDYCYIMVYIKYVPEEVTNLEDAYIQAELLTRTSAESAVNILNGYGINENVDVWAQLPLKDGGVTVLGHAGYDVKTDTFHDFELYVPQ